MVKCTHHEFDVIYTDIFQASFPKSMLTSSRFGLRETSERTLEFNVLNELAAYLWMMSRLTLTVISPTQVEEDTLGFDDIVEGLPPGKVLAVQFKRPKQMIRLKNAVRFTLDTLQLNNLARNSGRGEAYMLLAPLPLNQQVVNYRRRLLTVTIAIDVFDVPNLTKTAQRTRTVRVYPSVKPARVEIADPKRYQAIDAFSTVAELGKRISSKDIGIDVSAGEKGHDVLKKIGVRKLYYLHIGRAEGHDHYLLSTDE